MTSSMHIAAECFGPGTEYVVPESESLDKFAKAIESGKNKLSL